MEHTAKVILETRILLYLNDWAGHYSLLDGAARALAVFGILPLIVAVVWLAVCYGPGWRRWGGVVTLVSVAPALYVISLLDQFLCRPRPFLNHPVRLLLCISSSVSSPSWEMAAAAAIVFGLFAYSGRWRCVPFAYLVLLGVARVYCGIEYPLDQVWAALVGFMAALATMFVLNPRHVFLKHEGWPVGIVGTAAVLCAVMLFPHIPAYSIPVQQSTYKSLTSVASAEEKVMVPSATPLRPAGIAAALAKLHLPGQIRRVKIGKGEFTSVAAIKFDAGTDSNAMPRQVMDREALAILRASFAAAPEVSEVDVFAVTKGMEQGRQALRVVYSVAAKRKAAGFLYANPPAKLTPAQAVSEFGLVFYRPSRGRA